MVCIGGCTVAAMMPRLTEPPSAVWKRVIEAHRTRRTRDQGRTASYANSRLARFARWFGFIGGAAIQDDRLIDSRSISPIGFTNLRRVLPADRRGVIPMDANPKIHVVLSDDLLSHLRRVAQSTHVPLRWLVVGLICDTLETTTKLPATDYATRSRRIA
jgi:hypothetical protein